MIETVPPQCDWIYAESRAFGPEVEEFHKLTYQHSPRSGLISRAAAGYHDAGTAQRAFDSILAQIDGCAAASSGRLLVGTVTASADSVRTRPGDCGRDYRVKAAVLVEVTFCAFPESVPELVMTNIVVNVPG